MSQIEAPKVISFALLGPPAGNLTASKVVAFVLVQPGSIEPGAQGQGHVSTQILRRS